MENEISLREIIETIWKGKWLIAIIIGVVLFFAIVYSFFIASPMYEGKASITVTKTEQPIGTLNEYVHNVTSTSTIVEIMQSPEVLQKTIDELSLENHSVSSLQKNLKINTSESNESLVTLSLQGTDRDLITKIIDSVVVNTKASISEELNSYIESYEKLYLEKMDEQQLVLDDLLKDYNALENSNDLPLLVLFKQNIADVESQYIMEANESLLAELKNLDKVTQIEFEQVTEKINQANVKYEQYYSNYNDALTASSLDIVNERVQVLSNAFAASNPVSPNKGLNLAIAFVLGLMIGVFTVFLRAYWRSTDEEYTKTEEEKTSVSA